MPISTVWILKYVQQCYVKWFRTISSLGAPDASSIIASNLIHHSANIATIVTFFFSIIVLFYFCLNQGTFNDLVKDIFNFTQEP